MVGRGKGDETQQMLIGTDQDRTIWSVAERIDQNVLNKEG